MNRGDCASQVVARPPSVHKSGRLRSPGSSRSPSVHESRRLRKPSGGAPPSVHKSGRLRSPGSSRPPSVHESRRLRNLGRRGAGNDIPATSLEAQLLTKAEVDYLDIRIGLPRGLPQQSNRPNSWTKWGWILPRGFVDPRNGAAGCHPGQAEPARDGAASHPGVIVASRTMRQDAAPRFKESQSKLFVVPLVH